ncbi:MAG: VWA domain-containing protein [Chthoniobacterales bacterium]|nr:VWA domain-containing protein [Chthoniobacterales bacterium]
METSALSFARPALLNALWLLPLVVALFWWAERRRRALIGRIVAPKLRVLLAGSTSPGRRLFRGACVLLALGLLVVTLAGPRLGYDTLEVPHRGRDVIIAMDVSRSMLAPDVAPSRLQRAKLLAEDLIGELGSDRVGLVAFAGSAFLQAPLTLDHGAVLAALDELDTTVIPKGGTNIAAAIRMAEEAFGKAEGFSRALIIISDGEELDADGIAAARSAGEAGIRIFTVGVGSAEGSEIPIGGGEFVRDASGKVVQSRLDETRMAEIAEAAGGFYAPLDENAARRLSVDGIGKLSESDITTNSSRRPIERYQWPLGVAIGLLFLQALVGERRRRPVVAAGALALWLFSIPPAWASADGVSAYEQGNYEAARAAFEQRLKMEPNAPGLQLNAGTAAYRLKDYNKASEYFSRAMLAEDPALRSAAEFNLGNTLFRQGEGQQDKAKKITDWKDAIAKYEAAMKTRPGYTDAKENKEHVEKLLKELEKQQEEEKKQDQQQDQQKQDQKQDQNQQQQSGGGQQDKQKDQQKGDQDKDKGGDKQEQQPSGGGQDEKQDQQNGQSKDQQQQSEGGKQDGQKGDQSQEQKDQKQDGQGQQQPQDQQKEGEGGQPKEQQKEGPSGGKDQQPQEGPEEQKGNESEEGKGEEQQGENERKPEPRQDGRPSNANPQSGQSGDEPEPVPEQSGEKKEGELRGAQPDNQGEGPGDEAVAAGEAEEEQDGRMSSSQARALLRALQSEEEQVNLLERRNLQDVSRDW